MLTDDSAGEQAAVKKAFPGLEVGEMEVTFMPEGVWHNGSAKIVMPCNEEREKERKNRRSEWKGF
jgi:hypothetical protein